jgi:Tol biopolymer transport system component
MHCIRTRSHARARLVLTMLGTVALGACDDRNESPTEPVPQPADASLKEVSKNALIAFTSDRDGGNPEIYVMQANGKRQKRLTNNTDFDLSPAWSPDRTKIAFASFPSGGTDVNVFVMNADGTGRVQLTNDPSSEQFPDWAPDGSKIAFSRDGQIIVMNADGTNQTALPHTIDDNDSDPDWSPDGTKIAFSRDRGQTQQEEIWVMNADGSGAVQLTQNSGQDGGASWSPDGTRIAFVSVRTAASEVFVMNADGSGQTALTSGAAAGPPAWSPDGSKLAFHAQFGGNGDIYVINADGSGQTQLTTDLGSDVTPAWAR